MCSSDLLLFLCFPVTIGRHLLLLEFHGVKDLLKNQRDNVTATGKYLEDALEELELFIMKNEPKKKEK